MRWDITETPELCHSVSMRETWSALCPAQKIFIFNLQHYREKAEIIFLIEREWCTTECLSRGINKEWKKLTQPLFSHDHISSSWPVLIKHRMLCSMQLAVLPNKFGITRKIVKKINRNLIQPVFSQIKITNFLLGQPFSSLISFVTHLSQWIYRQLYVSCT